MIQDRAILTVADQQIVVYDRSNGANFNDLEQHLTQFSKSRHYLMLNMSATVRDTDVVSMDKDLHMPCSRVSFPMTLSDLAKY